MTADHRSPTTGLRVALTIAGSDSSGGAGIQADLKTFAALGVYGTSATTAITAQSTVGVVDVVMVPADFVTLQMETVAGDIAIHAVKTGMLGDAAIVEAVAAAVKELDLPLLVVDPVLASTSGEPLLDAEGVQMLITELLPLAHVVTPNVPEAEILSGMRIGSEDSLQDAARRIHEMGAAAVIITGGHWPPATDDGPPTTDHRPQDDVVDTLFDGQHFVQFRTPRIDSRNTHGTGCTYAAAVAAYLALGHPLADAAARAQQYVAGAIQHSLTVGKGAGLLDHFWTPRT